MEYNLNLSIEQKLVMTQQMQLSVKLLQMSTFELQQYVDKELIENPVLEIEPNIENLDQGFDKIDYKELIKYFDSQSEEGKYYKADNEEVSPLNFISTTKSLKEFLKEQLLEININKVNKAICEYLIENIDEKGYFDSTIENISLELNIDIQQAKDALEILQTLEPTGVGARDLKECLKIQLHKKGNIDENLYSIIDNYLEYVGDHKFTNIAKALSINVNEVQALCDVIRSLEPKPGRGYFTGESTEYIVPDAFITKIDDEYVIFMNDEAVPRLKINSTYKNIIMHENDKDTVNYVKDKINSAMFLISSIERRKSTIYKILEKILETQKDYFDLGSNYLKPMTIKNVADSIGVHESTASRAIKGKYISTELGIVLIKKLFTTGLSTATSEEDISTKRIKNRIEELICKENKKFPLSDQKLCELLNEDGVNVARRTVSKYREQLGMLSSNKRKRF